MDAILFASTHHSYFVPDITFSNIDIAKNSAPGGWPYWHQCANVQLEHKVSLHWPCNLCWCLLLGHLWTVWAILWTFSTLWSFSSRFLRKIGTISGIYLHQNHFRRGKKHKDRQSYISLVKSPISYNKNIRLSAFNVLEEVLSILYLPVKYPLDSGRVRVSKEVMRWPGNATNKSIK